MNKVRFGVIGVQGMGGGHCDSILSNKSRLYQLTAIADMYLEFGSAYPARARFLHAIGFSGLYDEVFNFTEFWISIFESVTAFFAKGREVGFFRDDLCSSEIARHFIGTAESAMRSIIYCPETLERPPSSERIVQMVLSGIGARGEGIEKGMEQ